MPWYTRWNYFDKGTNGHHYARRRTLSTLALIVAGVALVRGADQIGGAEAGRLASVVVSLLIAVWVGVGFIRYLRCLDEMQRLLHYESIAVVWGLLLAALVPLAVLHSVFELSFNPLYLVGFELLRGVVINWLTWRRTAGAAEKEPTQ